MEQNFLPKARFPIERFSEQSERPKGSVRNVLSEAGVKTKGAKE